MSSAGNEKRSERTGPEEAAFVSLLLFPAQSGGKRRACCSSI